MNRAVLLIFALVAASGVWVTHHWGEIRLYMGVDKPAEVHAIELAKSEYSMERIRTNHEAIEDFVASDEGIEPIGWRAEPRPEGRHLVKFLYTLDGVDDAFRFEVKLDSQVVVYLDAERDLVERFHPPASPR